MFFCGISFSRPEKVTADVLPLKLLKEVERGDVKAILLLVEEKSYVTSDLIIQFCNETLHERVVEHIEESCVRIMDVKIGPEIAFGNKTRVGRNPGLPGDFSKSLQIAFLPRSNRN